MRTLKLVHVQNNIAVRQLTFKELSSGTEVQVNVIKDNEDSDYWSALKEGDEFELSLSKKTEEKEVENEQPQD